MHQRSDSAALIDEMLFVAAIVASIAFLICVFLVDFRCERTARVPKSAFGYVIACGVAGCAYNRLNVMLSGALDSVIFFPIFNGSVILITTVAGVFLFGERMKRGQVIGFVLGALSLILVA